MRRADFRLPADGSRAACLRNWLRKSVSWLVDLGPPSGPPDRAQACAIGPGWKPGTTAGATAPQHEDAPAGRILRGRHAGTRTASV
jgi:hypothetical protein